MIVICSSMGMFVPIELQYLLNIISSQELFFHPNVEKMQWKLATWKSLRLLQGGRFDPLIAWGFHITSLAVGFMAHPTSLSSISTAAPLVSSVSNDGFFDSRLFSTKKIQQVLLALKTYKLQGFLDSSIVPPPHQGVLPHLIGMDFTAKIWNTLASIYGGKTTSRLMFYRRALHFQCKASQVPYSVQSVTTMLLDAEACQQTTMVDILSLVNVVTHKQVDNVSPSAYILLSSSSSLQGYEHGRSFGSRIQCQL
ncbi:hypothetical protein GOBAR_AA12927 [Gossypium barbadense]|uniref:Uncharacterized protein n=1 Tax=Gossypium barbadense TaxID=3634 RepID=A0A2P5XWS2_GOSBA|nr:hypothetical protein GOBAR_AA12927 [Gossypium barbadense]